MPATRHQRAVASTPSKKSDDGKKSSKRSDKGRSSKLAASKSKPKNTKQKTEDKTMLAAAIGLTNLGVPSPSKEEDGSASPNANSSAVKKDEKPQVSSPPAMNFLIGTTNNKTNMSPPNATCGLPQSHHVGMGGGMMPQPQVGLSSGYPGMMSNNLHLGYGPAGGSNGRVLPWQNTSASGMHPFSQRSVPSSFHGMGGGASGGGGGAMSRSLMLMATDPYHEWNSNPTSTYGSFPLPPAPYRSAVLSAGVVPNNKNFPETLFDVLSLQENAHIISWLPHGHGFMIHDKQRFASMILPRYFDGAKFTSFTRRLKRWSFVRVPRGPELGAYYNKVSFVWRVKMMLGVCLLAEHCVVDCYSRLSLTVWRSIWTEVSLVALLCTKNQFLTQLF